MDKNVNEKEPEAIEPSEERSKLIEEYEKAYKALAYQKARRETAVDQLKKLMQNDPRKGPGAEKIKELLEERYRVRKAVVSQFPS
jgi:hypothetical protein